MPASLFFNVLFCIAAMHFLHNKTPGSFLAGGLCENLSLLWDLIHSTPVTAFPCREAIWLVICNCVIVFHFFPGTVLLLTCILIYITGNLKCQASWKLFFGANGGTWTPTLKRDVLSVLCLPFHHTRVILFSCSAALEKLPTLKTSG